MIRVVFLLVCFLMTLATSASVATSGPFGFTPGMTKDQITKLVGPLARTERKNSYATKKVPRPHPLFESYILVIDPTRGLVKVGASSRTLETSTYGTQLRAEFSRVSEALEDKYGPGQEVDRLRADSIWHREQHWMVGLLRKERELAVSWDKDSGFKPQEGITAVYLTAVALTRDKGVLVLDYEFSGFDEFWKDQEQKAL